MVLGWILDGLDEILDGSFMDCRWISHRWILDGFGWFRMDLGWILDGLDSWMDA